MSSFYNVGFYIGAILTFLIGVVVLFSDSRRSVNRSWAVLSLLVSIWFLGRLIMVNAGSAETARLGQKIAFTGSIFLTVAYCNFVYAYLDRKTDLVLISGYLVSSVLFLLNWFSKLFILRVVAVPILNYYELAGPFYIIHVIAYLAFPGYGFHLLVQHKKASPGPNANQIRFLLLASNIGFLCGLTTFPMNYGVNFPPLGAPFISLYVLIIAYAILVHRLLDFNLVIRWGLAFSASFVSVVLVYLVVVSVAERVLKGVVTPGVLTVASACLSVLIFDPLRRRITEIVDQLIFKSPDLEVLLHGIEEDVLNSSTSEDFADRLTSRLKGIWKIDHAGIALWDSMAGCYTTLPKQQFENQVVARPIKPIQKDDFLIRTLETERRLFKYGIVAEDDLNSLANGASNGERTTLWKIRRTLRWHGAAIAAPLMMANQLNGFIILGSKANSSVYNEDDKKLLSHVAEVVERFFGDRFARDFSGNPALNRTAI